MNLNNLNLNERIDGLVDWLHYAWRRFWHFPAFLEGFFIGDRVWGSVRLLITALLVLVCVILSRDAVAKPSFGLLNPRSWRYLVVPLAALIGAILVGAHYLQDIYELPGLRLALHYLVATLYAIDYPQLTISEGKKQVDPEKTNLIDAIGGPGYVRIAAGNVALFERLTEPSNVRGSGQHFISRFETIREIASLEDQHGYVETVSATSKDGIEVIVRDIHFRYRLYPGHRPRDYTRRTVSNPYPYSIQAVRNMAYNRSVAQNGLASWHAVVRGTVVGVISEYINTHQFDQLVTPRPPEEDPRAAMGRNMQSKRTRERLRGVGVDLLWFDIGYFEAADPAVAEQHVDTWQAKWEGDADVTRAYGEAQRLANQELGRAEAQADMLVSLTQALEESGIRGSSDRNVLNVFLARTAQILDALTQASSTREAGSGSSAAPTRRTP